MTDYFAVNDFLEPSTGIVHRYYTYKRRPCRRIVLHSKLAQQLAGYYLIEKDLRSILTWLSELEKLGGNQARELNQSFHGEDRDTFNLVKGLFVAVLVFYGKCFSKCEGRPVKLERSQLDKRFHKLHDECISYRHNFAAHSGAKRLEKVEITLVLPVKPAKSRPFKLFKELVQPDAFWPAAGEISLVELIEHVRSIAQKKIYSLNNKITQDEVVAKADDLWPK